LEISKCNCFWLFRALKNGLALARVTLALSTEAAEMAKEGGKKGGTRGAGHFALNKGRQDSRGRDRRVPPQAGRGPKTGHADPNPNIALEHQQDFYSST
jgi:hypothetical protein